ncbi:MAG: class I SAM-dependent methyltransferase [Anaerolineaceae bacterium]|nr:class I SAM-dependent methyltransferase [Anaerolineaceae bacterium]
MDYKFSKDIRAFYERGLEENRLFRGLGVLELLRTKEILKRFLPESPCVVYDVGGGSGVYSRWLTSMGHEVHLVDPIPLLIEQAREESAKRIGNGPLTMRVGDARNLFFSDATADCILLLGPLYHLISMGDRLQALREAYRVLKPGGILFAAAISCYASTTAGLFFGYITDEDFLEMCLRELRSGNHQRPESWPMLFAEAYFHRPEQLKEELETASFQESRILAVEGPGWFMREFKDVWVDRSKREAILRVIREVEEDPIAIGISPHFLGIARKPEK